jgi:hypothetical protein
MRETWWSVVDTKMKTCGRIRGVLAVTPKEAWEQMSEGSQWMTPKLWRADGYRAVRIRVEQVDD